MGKSVVWTPADQAANPEKKIFVGTQFQGVLDARDHVDSQGKMQTVYRIKLDGEFAQKFGEYVSVWETATIRSGMEEGFKGKPIPLGAIVRFTHKGMKKSMTNKSAKPYHDIQVEYHIPNAQFHSADTAPTAAQVAQGDTGENLDDIGL